MDEDTLRNLANAAWTTALSRSTLQSTSKQLDLKATGTNEQLADRVLFEARRRLHLPQDPLEDESWVEPSLIEELPQPKSTSLRGRLQRGLGSLMSISSRQAPEPQRRLEPESVAANPSTTIRAICRRSPRKTPKRDGIRRDLEEAATPIATTPHAAASTPPPVPTPTKPFHAISEPFVFGSSAQPPRSNAEFAHSQAAFASYDYVKAEEAIRRELEARTGRRISTGPVVVTAKAQTKATAQQALGQRYESSHQREFQKMDSIANHASVRRLPSSQALQALQTENGNGKRSASSTSLTSMAGPAVKRLRVASATLTEPTPADNRITDGLKQEGWTDGHAARRQEARRQLRKAEAKVRRKSVGRALPPLPPPKSTSFIGRAVRAMATAPAPSNPSIPKMDMRPAVVFGSHTAARSGRTLSVASGSVASKATARQTFDLRASLSKGTKYRPMAPRDALPLDPTPAPQTTTPASSIVTRPNVPPTTTQPQRQDVFGKAAVRPRIHRAEMQALADDRLQRDRDNQAIDKISPNKPALYHAIGHRSPFKPLSSPDKKVRSSAQVKARAVL